MKPYLSLSIKIQMIELLILLQSCIKIQFSKLRQEEDKQIALYCDSLNFLIFDEKK